MKVKTAILSVLGRDKLKALVDQLQLEGVDRRSVDNMRQALSKARGATPTLLADQLSEQETKAVCDSLALPSVGRRKALIQRLLGGDDVNSEPQGPRAADEGGDDPAATHEGPRGGGRGMAKQDLGDKRPIEPYEHSDKTRTNNPPVGLVTPATDPDLPVKTYQYDPHLDPQLVWAGKAEHTSFDVPTVSLHVHERIDPRTIIRAVQKQEGKGEAWRQLSLFESQAEYLPLRQAVEFYKHPHGWSNRLIAGDSLVVMNSLLQKEGMAGKVQMIYIDPPYGIRYGSNFQPFVYRREVKDGDDEDLTQEPEMIKAFRDTWELGIHSYLTYLRDRLLVARELLHESGSVFVQINDDNLPLIRQVCGEVLNESNFVGQITFRTTANLIGNFLGRNSDYLVWYARDIGSLKYRQVFSPKTLADDIGGRFTRLELPDGGRRVMTTVERADPTQIPAEARVYRHDNLTSQGATATTTVPFEFEGALFHPGPNRHWTTSLDGLARLALAGRLAAPSPNSLTYVRYLDDFPVSQISNVWGDTQTGAFTDAKVYAVQTNTKVIERCLLMTTDPGDLVFDPTCGSGTTAYVAEHWGRRWITCDTSRVAITLAKQRLMTAHFDYYTLARPDEGVGSGFVYKTVRHVTLKSIANNPEIREGMTRAEIDAAIMKYAERETLYDQPDPDRRKARVSGPFTVEAVPAPAVRPIAEIVVESRPATLEQPATPAGIGPLEDQPNLQCSEGVCVARYGETYRQRQWRDELRAAGIRGRSGQRIEFARLEAMGGTRWLQCQGETKATAGRTNGGKKAYAEGDGIVHRVVVTFGPEHAPMEQRQVSMALDEAQRLRPAPTMVVFAAFQFDPEAAKDIDETNWPGMTLLKVQMNTDLLTDDLKKARSSNESYWLMGQPDVQLRRINKGEHQGKYEVEVHGFDYYNTRTGQIESGDTTKIAMWMLDTDYDGRSLFPRQVFFPMAGPKDGWARLAKNLKAEIDDELIEAFRGTVSLPFAPGEYRRVAVKIVDDRGIESLKIVEIA